MRRKEFEVTDKEAVKKVLDECEYGVLSLMSDNEPYGVAVNFVLYNDMVCFHGAKEGRKVEAIKSNAQASFLAIQPYAMIPSYFSNTRAAYPATQFFTSVHIYGEVSTINDASEKAQILEAMMQKLQSEGGYDTISVDNPIYTKALEKTGVYALKPQTTSLKVKAGQNLSDERKQEVIQKLMQRDKEKDISTVELMLSIIDEKQNIQS